jgi:hypothetical protein
MASTGGDRYLSEFSFASHVQRSTVDLSAFPNLIVMYLGMRANSLRGIPTMLKFGRRIGESVKANPPGLLGHERIIFSPRHVGMRQYWRDFEALESWARDPPHLVWWKEYLKDTAGTGFWHEMYSKAGGFEAIYDNIRTPTGLQLFAPSEPATGGMFSARRRLERGATPPSGEAGGLPPAP